MELPVLQPISSNMDGVTGFTGYNHGLKIGTTEFFDQRNITGEFLPVIRPRRPRGIVRRLTKANGLFAHDRLGWIDGTTLYYDGTAVGTVTDTEKTVIRMGAYVIIWPDKVYYNTRTGEFGSLEAHYASTGAVSAVLCRADGNPYSNYIASQTPPATHNDGDYWLDTSDSSVVLRQYSSTSSMWESIATVYVKISAAGIGSQFSVYDGVTIAGMDDNVLNGEFYIVALGTDYIVITAVIQQVITTNSNPVVASRTVPQLDYVTENNNRLWGCSNDKNEIYACALGDPKNWNQFVGVATDSYVANVGSPGDFTGAVTQLGNVLFFKENIVHEVMGTIPSNFNIDSLNIRGAAKGSAKSLCIVNEMLYYMAANDVCAFSQSLPSSISQAFGREKYKNAVGGTNGNQYYLCVEDSVGSHHLFVYYVDDSKWTKMDDITIRWFAQQSNDLYFISNNTIYSVNGDITSYPDANARLEDNVEWMLETGDIGIDYPANKYISRAQLYVSLQAGTGMKVEVQTDARGDWTTIANISSSTQRSVTIPVSFNRCRTFKIRMTGTGEFKLWNMVWNVSTGSDVYAS